MYVNVHSSPAPVTGIKIINLKKLSFLYNVIVHLYAAPSTCADYIFTVYACTVKIYHPYNQNGGDF